MNEDKTHESYGMLSISKFFGNNSQFFGSDLVHGGGMSITISSVALNREYHKERYYSEKTLIRVELTNSQFIDAITSGMNTPGVPCTITSLNNKSIPKIDYISNKKEQFSSDMKDTHKEYKQKIDNILKLLEGNIGKRKADEIKHELGILRSHIESNTNFVMTCFKEAMEKTVTEAKHSVSNYIDHKINSLGIEGLRKEIQISIENNKE